MIKQLQISNSLCPSLTVEEKEIVSYREGAKIREMKKAEIGSLMSALILKTHLECGQTGDEKLIALTIDDLLKDLQSYFGGFTFNQIAHAFKLGLMDEFGEWFGLNNKTYLQWAKGYLGSQKRLEANKKQDSYIKEMNKLKELTQEEKDKIVYEGVLKTWDEFKLKGYVLDIGNTTYNFLDKKGLIPFTITRKREIYAEVKNAMVLEKTEALKTPKDRLDKLLLKKGLDELLAGSHEDLIKIECRRRALNIFFKDLLETGTELTDLI